MKTVEKIQLTEDEIKTVRQLVNRTYQYLGSDMPQLEDEPNWVKMEIIFDANYMEMADKVSGAYNGRLLTPELQDKLDKFVQQELKSVKDIRYGFKKLSKLFWE